MNKLSGENRPLDMLERHTHVCDLIHVEFPVLSLFTDGRRNWIYMWCDRNERGTNRWLLFVTSRQDLMAYLGQKEKKASLLTLIQNTDRLFIYENADWARTDRDATERAYSLSRRHLYEISIDQIGEYLPTEDSYFDESLTDDLNLSEQIIPTAFDLPLSGEYFSVDFVQVLKRYERLYGFFYAAGPRFVKSVNETLNRLLRSPWTGGYSRVNLFEILWEYVPGIHTLKVQKALYQSPGQFKFEAIASIGESIKNSTLLLISYSEEIEDICEQIRSLLKGANLNKVDLSKVPDDAITSLRKVDLLRLIDRCAHIGATLKVTSEFEVLRQLSPNTVVYSKAVLSFVGQLTRFSEYQRQGMLNFH